MLINILALVIYSFHISAGEQCQKPQNFKEIDLRSEMGPVRNQGGLGWCYGFAAADLMTHYLYKKGAISKVDQDNMVSALSVSADNNREYLKHYNPEKELVNNKYVAEKKAMAEEEKKKWEATKKNFLEKIDVAKNIIVKLNPFKENRPVSPSVSVSTPTPTPIPQEKKLSVPKQMKTSDFISWDDVDSHRDYAKRFVIPREDRKKIWEEAKKTGSFTKALERYYDSLKEMKAAELAKNGVSTFANGGYVSLAIESAKNSFCTESEVRSGDIGIERFDLKSMLDSIYDLGGKKENISCSVLNNIHNIFPKLKLEEIFSVLEEEDRNNAYEILVQKSCKRKLSLNSDEPQIEGWTLPLGYADNESIAAEAQIELLKRLDHVLDTGTPVSITYFSRFLNTVNGPKEGQHASSIVGKRINPKTCKEEYILRNSYGQGCALYRKINPDYVKCIAEANKVTKEKLKNKMKSICDQNNTPTYINPRVSCEDGTGYLFVEKDELAKNIFGMTYLKEKN